MRHTSKMLLVAAAVLLLTSAGCSVQLPKGAPGITGTITSLSQGEGAAYVALVEGGKQPEGALSDKASVTIDAKTVVADEQGKRMGAHKLRKGMSVRVWFEGPVAESYPVQGRASYVQVR